MLDNYFFNHFLANKIELIDLIKEQLQGNSEHNSTLKVYLSINLFKNKIKF